MILFLYNVAMVAALAISAPWWLWRMATTHKYRDGLGERLGYVRQMRRRLLQANLSRARCGEGDSQSGPRLLPMLWIHAVSVGEVLAISRLVSELDQALPGYFVAISTTTRTGQELARMRFGADRVFYCPLDIPRGVRLHLQALQPRMLILAETEFWPNLLAACHRRGVPVVVVNARVSDRSWPRYRILRLLWLPFLARITRVVAQTEKDAERLRELGCPADRVLVGGNLKFDIHSMKESDVTGRLRAMGAGLRWIVAGSTLEGEEAALIAVWREVRAAQPDLAMVLAPRHPERFAAVELLLRKSGIPTIRRSDWHRFEAGTESSVVNSIQPGAIVLLDSIGDLASVYSLASVAFVGGSLVPAGGHNPLEPAQFAVPILMGPHVHNFRAITDLLLAGGGLKITQPEALSASLLALLGDPVVSAEMGTSARRVFDQQAGATARAVAAICEILGEPLPGSDAFVSAGRSGVREL